MLGVSLYTVSVWERGVRIPDRENIEKLAEIFSVLVRRFYLEGKDEMEDGDKGERKASKTECETAEEKDQVAEEYIITITVRRKGGHTG